MFFGDILILTMNSNVLGHKISRVLIEGHDSWFKIFIDAKE